MKKLFQSKRLKNVGKAIKDWLWCIPSGGRCQHDMLVSGKACRRPKGHDGPHTAYRTGIRFLDPKAER